jgi:hypothetical protein
MSTVPINAELQKVIDDAAKGILDPKRAEEACRRMDKDREELRKKVGELDVAVDLIREARDS